MDGDGNEKQLQRVVVDFVLNWEPTSEKPVDLKNVEDVVEAIANYYSIQRITFDRWNSAPGIQNLIEKGFFAEDLSFSNAQQLGMYRNLKLLVHNTMITWPANDDLLLELKFLKLENGKEVTSPRRPAPRTSSITSTSRASPSLWASRYRTQRRRPRRRA